MRERVIYDPGAPVPIRRYVSEGLAAVDKALLEAADIPSFIRLNRFGEVDVGVVFLVVRQEHARTALALLDELPTEGA
jgi:hypothetical protein